tara:strand:- start:18910 stop:20349 length:1440 start_codon:yes stop_codon:yes gene_type:complete
MGNSLISAMQTKDSLTENGMVTNSTSLNHCVDLFFQIGAMRGADKTRLINVFTKAFGENPLTAMRLLFWARDVRGGAGERQIFKDIISYLAENRTEVLGKNIHLISEFGRWDDILVLFGTALENQALVLITEALNAKNSLTAKWMPRPNVANPEAKRQANTLRKHLGLSPKDYRKLLVENSNTVEQLMCAGEWSKIEYSKLPSKAMSDLMKAFSKNDLARFQEYLTSVEKGEAKINAGALYPYDVIKNLKQNNEKGANVQWNALPNFLESNNERFLPVVDVSGSMECPAGTSKTVTCMDVAISLGLYISEKNIGAFKDAFVTFTSNPQLQVLKGSLSERYNQLSRADWGMSTNVEKVFKLILDKAIKGDVQEADMPTMIIILSDMEFNQGTKGEWNSTAQEMFERMYSDAGYIMPKIVYWNIKSRSDENKPVQFDKNGTALISGFSANILTNLLGGKEMNPYSMMMNVIDSERYQSVTI